MPAKKTAKKKLTPRAEANKRYRANKVAREAAALIDAVIQPVAPEPELESPIYGDADNFNEFAPNMGMGEAPIDQETGQWTTPEVPTTEPDLKQDPPPAKVWAEDDQEEVFPESWMTTSNFERIDAETEQRMAVEAVSLPSPAPVVTSAPSPGHIVPQVLPDTLEPPSDALVVERLINGINHLYGFAKTIKGIRGPQPDHIARIQANLIQARALLARLK